MSKLNQRMANGIAWMVAARLADRAIGVVSTLILARLLVPADFGLVAMATAIGGVLELMGAFSFDMALIQHRQAERRHYDTVWTFGVIFGCACTLILALLAAPAAAFYHEPRLQAVVYVLALSYLINAFSNVGVVAFRKELEFGKEFQFILIRRLVTFTLTIGLAWWLHSYWALVAGMTAGRLVNVLMSYRMHHYRPRLCLSAAGELFHFSKWLLINNALFFMVHDGATFLIGRMFGAAGLGIYTVSYEISNLPSTELVAPINRAAFPAFSKMQERSQIARAYLGLLGIIALLILPVGVGIAAVAEPLVLTALGPQWTNATPLIQLLALHGALAALQGNNGTVWLAMGKPRATTVAAVMFVAVLFPALYLCMQRYGVIGAGYAYLLVNTLTLPYGLWMSQRLLGFTWRSVAATLWRPLAAVVLMYGAVHLAGQALAGTAPALRLTGCVAVGAACYAGATLAMWWLSGLPDGAERNVIHRRFSDA
jgi:O-antigen/teichoic acid export membrane protein